MSSVQEIEEVIERLPKPERDALQSHILAKPSGLSAFSDVEQAELLRSLDGAERNIDEGRSHSAGDMRQALRGWLGK
jgi:hypothetical protein